MIAKLWLRFLNRPDPCAVMQTLAYRYVGYDQGKAVQGWRKAQRQTPTGRLLVKPKPTKRVAAIVPLRRAK